MQCNYVPDYTDSGAVRGFYALISDITTRKKAEVALRESENQFRQLSESLPQLVWTCEPAGPCDYLNRQFAEYTGMPEEEQLGFGWFNQVHPADQDGLLQAWKTAVATGS